MDSESLQKYVIDSLNTIYQKIQTETKATRILLPKRHHPALWTVRKFNQKSNRLLLKFRLPGKASLIPRKESLSLEKMRTPGGRQNIGRGAAGCPGAHLKASPCLYVELLTDINCCIVFSRLGVTQFIWPLFVVYWRTPVADRTPPHEQPVYGTHVHHRSAAWAGFSLHLAAASG